MIILQNCSSEDITYSNIGFIKNVKNPLSIKEATIISFINKTHRV
jgi:hypothetical protein